MIELFPENTLYQNRIMNPLAGSAKVVDVSASAQAQVMPLYMPEDHIHLPFVSSHKREAIHSMQTEEEIVIKSLQKHNREYPSSSQKIQMNRKPSRRKKVKSNSLYEVRWFISTILFCFICFAILACARMYCHGELREMIHNTFTAQNADVEMPRVIAVNKTQTAQPYKIITIKDGDSLWSIAKENMSEEYLSVNEMVKSISMYNHLESTKIYAGQTLKIPYYQAKQNEGI